MRVKLIRTMSASPWLLLALASFAAGTHIITIERDFSRVLQHDQLANHVSAITKKLKTFKIPVHPRVRLFYRLLKKSVAQFTAQHADSFFSPHKYNGDKNIQRDQEDDNDILRSSLRTNGEGEMDYDVFGEKQYGLINSDDEMRGNGLARNSFGSAGQVVNSSNSVSNKNGHKIGLLRTAKEIEFKSADSDSVDYFYEIRTKTLDENKEINSNNKLNTTQEHSSTKQNEDNVTEKMSKDTKAIYDSVINKNETLKDGSVLGRDTKTLTNLVRIPTFREEPLADINENRTTKASNDTTDHITGLIDSSTTTYDFNTKYEKINLKNDKILDVSNNKAHDNQTSEREIIQKKFTLPDSNRKNRSVGEMHVRTNNITFYEAAQRQGNTHNIKTAYRRSNQNNQLNHTILQNIKKFRIANADLLLNTNTRRHQINTQKNIIEKMKAAYQAQYE